MGTGCDHDAVLTARRIEISDVDDPFEFLYEQGLTDGLPVIPPTPGRVTHMLTGTCRAPDEVVVQVPPNLAPATVEKIAINAVMAGCKAEYLPVVIAAAEAACNETFNMHGVLATTYFLTPVIIVNGPIRSHIGVNCGMNCLGQGTRANAAIGRALQLLVRNIGGGRPGEVDRATLGNPGKYSFCFGENEECSYWEPLHVERGFEAESSVVTLFAGSGPIGISDQLSRDAQSLATTYGATIAAVTHAKAYEHGPVIVIVAPEHADTFHRDEWSKDDLRAAIQEVSARPIDELIRTEQCAEGLPPELLSKLGSGTPVAKFASQDDIVLVVAGGKAGKWGAVIQGWERRYGSAMTSRVIAD